MPKKVSQSVAAVFARSLNHAPTPWINAAYQGDEGQDVQVKFRLWVRKRGQSLHLETHAESPSYPGIIQKIWLSRKGLYEMNEAGIALVQCAMWEPGRSPAHPRAVWCTTAKDYMRRQELAQRVTLALPYVFHPRRGRPSVKRYQNPNMPISLHGGGRAALKRSRRTSLLMSMHKIMQIVEPFMDRRDATSLSGYTVPEQAAIRTFLTHVNNTAARLHDDAFYDRLLMTEAERQAVKDAPPVPVPSIEGFHLELLDEPVS